MNNELNVDVLVYITKLKTYLNDNLGIKDYFIGDSSEEYFFELIINTSINNFKKNGDPTLRHDQFELIRNTRKNKNVFKYGLWSIEDIILN